MLQQITANPRSRHPEFRANGAAVKRRRLTTKPGTKQGDRMYKAPADPDPALVHPVSTQSQGSLRAAFLNLFRRKTARKDRNTTGCRLG